MQRNRRTRAGIALSLGSALVATLAIPAVAMPAPDPADPGEQQISISVEDGPRVVVSELANGGPGGYHDNFIEITNLGSEPQDVTGWGVYRCTGGGSQASTPQVTLEGEIEPGGYLLLGRSAGSDTPDVPHAQSTIEADLLYHTSFTNQSYGAIIRDMEGDLVDAVGVKNPGIPGDDCVTGARLPNTTDSVLAESWQRVSDTGNNEADFIKAVRTPGAENATEPSPAPLGGPILISEVAHAGPEGADDHLVEIGNYGEEEVSIEGWELWRCNQFGRRFDGDLIATDLPERVSSGEALVVETRGFVDGAAGVILTNGDGTVVDAVAWADVQDSACALGQPLPYFDLDVEGGASYQRTALSGDNRDAFVAAPRGPGQLAANEPEDGNGTEDEEFLSTEGGPNVMVAEMTNTGPGGTGDIFFELVNYGDEPQDLTDWSVYRCVGTGVRASVPNIDAGQLEGRVLEPGERLTAARAGIASPEVMAAADVFFDVSFAQQYGLIVFDETMSVVDRLGSSIAGVENYCAQSYGTLPGTLSGVHAETWQRVDLTGDAATDFIAAPRTPGRVNHQGDYQRPSVPSSVRISEVTNGGEAGPQDNFIELTNLGDTATDIGGWHFYRCTGTGRTDEAARQLTFPNVTLQPGESYVAGRQGGFSGDADVYYSTSFAIDGGFGVMITDADLRVVDSVGVYTGVDSACTQGEPLPNDLDFVSSESWQRVDDTGDNFTDFARGLRTPGEHGGEIVSVQPEIRAPGDVQIVEMTNGGPADHAGTGSDQFVELGNRGEESVDISGWQIQYCAPDGRRDGTIQFEMPEGTTLDAGGAWTLVGPDAPEALSAVADGTSVGSMSPDGYGVLVLDADGVVVDRVAVFYDYAGQVTNAPSSVCSSGVPLDRRMSKHSLEEGWEHGLSFHRWQYSDPADNYHDYVVGDRDPGDFVQMDYHDPTVPEDGAMDPVDVERYEVPGAPHNASSSPVSSDDDGAAERLTANIDRGDQAALRGGQLAENEVRAFTGRSASAPLSARVGEDERDVSSTEVESAGYGRDYPYVRMEVDVGELGEAAEIAWTGSSAHRNELQMYLWDGAAWELADARAAHDGGEMTLIASLEPQHVRDGVVDVLVQDGPRTGEGLIDEVDQSFQDPGTYDFSLGHLTDTQYVTDQAPWVYTALNAWFAANHEARDIAFVMHTGDIIENALRGNQLPDRAIEEYERASAIQRILEDAGVPHSVLPGNHDNFWGNNNDLYLEYFPEERYADFEWWGGAGPRGATAHFALVEHSGVQMMFLSLPYDSTQAEIDWAADVIGDHPEHNVVLGTHEYLRPEPQVDERANPDNGRWSAQGDIFFDQLVEPYDNVVLTMSGHLHGVRQRVLEDVGATPGRTVVETVADYQSYHDDGSRVAVFNRLYQVDVDAGAMAINAYSPVLDSFEPHRYEHRHPDPESPQPDFDFTAEHDELVLPIDLMSDRRVASASVSVLTEVEEIAEGSVVEDITATWEGLVDGESYGWYATATDESMGRIDLNRPSAVASFTATDEVPDEPVVALGTALEEYVASGAVAGPLANLLASAAGQAERHLTAERTTPARGALERFVRHLDNPKRADTLTAEARDDLRDRATAILAVIG